MGIQSHFDHLKRSFSHKYEGLCCCYRSRRNRLCGSLLRLWSRSLWSWPLRKVRPLRERRQRPSPMRRQEEEGGRAILRPWIRIRRLRIRRIRLRTSIRLVLDSDCKNAYGLPVPCAAETPAEETKEKRSADAFYGYGGYGLGAVPYAGFGYGAGYYAANPWALASIPAPAEAEAEEAAAEEKKKRSADAYYGYGAGYGLGYGYGGY